MTAEKIFFAVCLSALFFYAMRFWYLQGKIDGMRDATKIFEEHFKEIIKRAENE